MVSCVNGFILLRKLNAFHSQMFNMSCTGFFVKCLQEKESNIFNEGDITNKRDVLKRLKNNKAISLSKFATRLQIKQHHLGSILIL